MNEFSSYKPKISKRKDKLSLEDLETLTDSWSKSYAKIPPEVTNETSKTVSKILKGYMPQILGKLLKHSLIQEHELESVGREVGVVVVRWCYVNSAIGTEMGFGNITKGDAILYMIRCNEPVLIYLAGYIDYLWDRNKIQDRKAKKLSKNLSSLGVERSKALLDAGSRHYQKTDPKYEPGLLSPFAIELNQIDIGELRK